MRAGIISLTLCSLTPVGSRWKPWCVQPTPLGIVAGAGKQDIPSLVTLDAPHVIVESVKWAERGGGFILRLYEAGKTGGKVRLGLGRPVQTVYETNLLEENLQPLEVINDSVAFTMRPFEIKTLFCAVN